MNSFEFDICKTENPLKKSLSLFSISSYMQINFLFYIHTYIYKYMYKLKRNIGLIIQIEV